MDLDCRQEQRRGGQNVCLKSQIFKALKLISRQISRRVTERKINLTFKAAILIIVQRNATQNSLFIILQVHSTCFGCQPHPSSGVHKTVTTASGNIA